MSPAALVTLTMRELDRLKVIQSVVDMGLKFPAAVRLRAGAGCQPCLIEARDYTFRIV